MNKIILFCWLLLMLPQLSLRAQQSGSLTLQQALTYAKENSPVLKNAQLDLEIAKKKIWETTAIGLPQVNSKFSYSYMLTVPELISSFSNFGQLFNVLYIHDTTLFKQYSQFPKPETQEPSDENDIRWGMTYDITVSQLLFSGAYLVGLQTTKVYKDLSEISIFKSEADLMESVSNAYYLVLIAESNKNILDTIYMNTEHLLNQMKELNKQGMIDETDVDQLSLTLSTINNSREMISRQISVAKNLLKFQMGYPMDQEVTLSDQLTQLVADGDLASYLSKEFNVKSNVDFRLLDAQSKLMGLNLKLQKSAFLPDVAAFYQHQENFNDKSFSFTPPDIIGLSVSIPLFGSGMKLAKVQQAKMGLEKMNNTKLQVEAGLITSFSEAKSSFQTGYAQYLVSQQNIALARRIYMKTLIKYKEGLASSLELTQAQNQYLQAQTSYYSAVMSMTGAKLKMDKLLK